MSGASSWGWRTPMPSSRIPPVRLAGFASTPCSGRCRSPEAGVSRTAVALAGGHDPAPSDLAASMSAQNQGDRLPLRVSATLACLMASAATDGGPESLLTRVDAAAALVAELPEEEGRA